MRNVAECPRRGVPKACCSDEGPGAEETACGHGPGLGVAGSGTFEASPRRRETSCQNQDSAFGDTISIAWHDFDKARAFGRGSSRRDDYRLEPFRQKLATKTKTQKIGYSA